MSGKRKMSSFTRRGFIKASVAAGGVLLTSNLVPLSACSANGRSGEEAGEEGHTNNPSGEVATV